MNNPILYSDATGSSCLPAIFISALVGLKLYNKYKQRQASKKTSSTLTKDDVNVYMEGSGSAIEGKVNARIYYPTSDSSVMNINIDKSLGIRGAKDQDTVLEAIIDSPYYTEEVFGPKSVMHAEWAAHNASYDIASSGSLGYKLMQRLSGSINPIESSVELDLRSLNNMGTRQKGIYFVISLFYVFED